MANTLSLTEHSTVGRLSTGAFSPWRQGCNPRTVHIGFMFYKLTLEPFFLWTPQFSHWNHSTNAPYSLSFTYQQHYTVYMQTESLLHHQRISVNYYRKLKNLLMYNMLCLSH